MALNNATADVKQNSVLVKMQLKYLNGSNEQILTFKFIPYFLLISHKALTLAAAGVITGSF